MNIVLGSDHRGVGIRDILTEYLEQSSHNFKVIGGDCTEHVDYPDVAAVIALAVSNSSVDRGILVCGSGIGMSIVANKFPGVRAALCHNEVAAELSRRHNDSNVLCLSGDLLGDRSCVVILETWLKIGFDNGRHAIRLDKIRQIEKELWR